MIKVANNDLKNANKNKNDEFYTSLEDIEKETKYLWQLQLFEYGKKIP